MKAMVLRKGGEPFVLEERPDPVPGPGEAVARVLACGSGLTIQHVRAGRASARYPIIIGHEITAEIVAMGSSAGMEDPGLRVGDPVTCYFYLNDGQDKWTRIARDPLTTRMTGYVGRDIDGGYAEYIKLPFRNFIRLPDGIDWKGKPADVGVITDAITTPYKVLGRGRVAPGEIVGVWGAGGGLGIHQVMMCRWANARVVAVDTVASKLEVCKKHGAEWTVDASKVDAVAAIRDITKGAGLDVAIDYVSTTRTLEQAIAALGIGGRMVTLGGAGSDFRASSADMLSKELELLGSRYASRQQII
ncbi:MAG: zinc-binding dehydrogenase, partial [Alphaproteobacteria bacterium]|nr:zinc-binding dehydrogenase [Alphaproteobacteria bacterium]